MPLYFELADGNLKLKKFARAQEFLASADWTLEKHKSGESDKGSNPETEDLLSKYKSRLLRSWGSLFTEIQDFQEAKSSLTKNIYLESVDKGPEHYSLSGSYYLMGNIFKGTGHKSEVLSFYNQMNLIWKKFLDNQDDKDVQNIKKVEVEQATNELNEVLMYVNQEYDENSDMATDLRGTLDRLYEFIIDIEKKQRNQGSKNNVNDSDDDEYDRL